MNTITATRSTILSPAALMESAYRGPCRILGAHITRVTRGGTEMAICPEYCDGACQLRKAAPERMTGPALVYGAVSGGTRCVMLSA